MYRQFGQPLRGGQADILRTQLLALAQEAVALPNLVVRGEMANDTMTLQVETACSGPDALIEKLQAAIREVTKLRGEVELVLPGSLPNDGKVIEDARSYR